MEKMQLGKYACLITVLLLLLSTAGCASGLISDDDPQKIADPMTENILVAMNDDNYSHFSQDFDEQMKHGLDETNYRNTIPAIKAKIGNYLVGTKQFVSAEKKDQATVVTYKAKFSQEPGDVIVRTVFSDVNGKKYISGFWLDSPKLRGN